MNWWAIRRAIATAAFRAAVGTAAIWFVVAYAETLGRMLTVVGRLLDSPVIAVLLGFLVIWAIYEGRANRRIRRRIAASQAEYEASLFRFTGADGVEYVGRRMPR